jgi:hypothetical protein
VVRDDWEDDDIDEDDGKGSPAPSQPSFVEAPSADAHQNRNLWEAAYVWRYTPCTISDLQMALN